MPTWYRLNGFACPIDGCKGQSQKYDWICLKDNTPVYISETGCLRCDANHCAKIIQCQFNCGNHGNHPVDQWKTPDLQGFTFALSHAVQLMNKAGATWVAALVVELGNQFGRK